eukprot:m.750744 g.750744  ORF g.750744 m.750744 type:complete len:136 (+) comp58982_c0_seq10:3611-4018(+)
MLDRLRQLKKLLDPLAIFKLADVQPVILCVQSEDYRANQHTRHPSCVELTAFYRAGRTGQDQDRNRPSIIPLPCSRSWKRYTCMSLSACCSCFTSSSRCAIRQLSLSCSSKDLRKRSSFACMSACSASNSAIFCR